MDPSEDARAEGMVAPLGRLLIYTHKIDAMAAFYAKHFGFAVSRRDGDRIVELEPETNGVTLLLHPASAKQKEGQVLVKLVFDVQDVDQFCESAKRSGLVFGKVHRVDGYAFANAKDPSGNAIQISSRAFVRR